jgi:hypothetical protein
MTCRHLPFSSPAEYGGLAGSPWSYRLSLALDLLQHTYIQDNFKMLVAPGFAV